MYPAASRHFPLPVGLSHLSLHPLRGNVKFGFALIPIPVHRKNKGTFTFTFIPSPSAGRLSLCVSHFVFPLDQSFVVPIALLQAFPPSRATPFRRSVLRIQIKECPRFSEDSGPSGN